VIFGGAAPLGDLLFALKDYLDVPEHLEKYKKGLPNGEMHDAIVSLHKIMAIDSEQLVPDPPTCEAQDSFGVIFGGAAPLGDNMTGYQFGMALKDYLDVPEHLEKYKKGLPNGEMQAQDSFGVIFGGAAPLGDLLFGDVMCDIEE
jgi:hypothetical protein